MLKAITFRKTLVSVLNGLCMLMLCYLAIEVFPILEDEKVLTQFSNQAHKPKLPIKHEYVFVNVASDKQLIDIEGDVGKEVITDRRMLTYFLRFLNEQNGGHQFLLLDLYFNTPAKAKDAIRAYDDSLGIALRQAKNILIGSLPSSEEDSLNKPLYPEVPQALISLASRGTKVYQWQLFQDGKESLPLKMYRQLQGKDLGLLYLNNMPLRFYLRNEDINQEKYTYFGSLEDFEGMVMGGEVMKDFRKEFFEANFKDKIIVLGNFSGEDMHLTQVGKMYGSLILLNAYLSLVAKASNISLWMILFLWAAFSVLCYRALYIEVLKAPAWLLPILRFPLFRFLDYFWILLLLSFTCHALFGIHISIVILFFYLKSVRYLVLGGRLIKLEEDLVIANQENEKLLLSIFPANIAQELKETQKVKPQYYESASILFADVNGFSVKGKELVQNAEQLRKEGKTPEGELIGLINTTFTQMDMICQKHSVERIKTIGDCYMSVAGIPVPSKTHAFDIVLAALEIQKWMKEEYQKRGGDFWRVRLGIHTGKVVTGVVGVQRYAYDVWGDDVNVASRMESKGEVEKVNTTIEVYEIIKDFFEFEDRGMIALKNEGEGKHHAFFVLRLKPEFSEDTEGFMPNQHFYTLRDDKFA